jgi:hypothetical protein
MIGFLQPAPVIKQGSDTFVVPEHQLEIRKLAAMAGDLRVAEFPGAKKVMTNAPTEGSKLTAYGQLKKTQRVGNFGAQARVGTLKPPGPSIKQIAVKIR